MARSLVVISSAVTLSILAYAASARAVDCFADSVNGNDSNTGLSEDQAVKTQSKLASLKNCTTAKYKRGSDFAEKVTMISGVTTYTNYGDPCAPLPKFHIPRSPNNGSMFNAMQRSVTIDGLYLSGSMSDASMSNLMNGICVGLGSNSKLLNSEITNCDIGVMVFGSGSLVKGNYIHDLFISVDAAPGVDPNAVGGAEGIFINGSNNEVCYNSFIRCTSKAEWTGGSCDGGATEVTVGSAGTLSGVKIHHNFSYQSCGFFEVSSMQGSTKGLFSDSEFYDNVSIDSGWLMLLQVNNTDMSNVKWTNNTIVQRKSTSINPGMLVTVFTATSSGMTGGDLQPNQVYLTNNLFVLDGFGSMDYVSPLHANLVQANNLTIKSPGTNAGLVNLAGSEPGDFDLLSGSPAVNQGAATSYAIDFLNRTVPSGGSTDIGAFEYGSSLASGQTTPIPAHLAVTGANCGNTGGTPGTGGTSTGGTATSTGGTATATGGSTVSGGESSTGGSSSPAGGSATGGASGTTGGTASDTGGANATGGVGEPGTETCSCRMAGEPSGSGRLGLLALVATLLLRRRRQPRVTH
jgi:MYXO-CTERM domain-containing protein